MSDQRGPSLPLPPAIRGLEVETFAYSSVAKRLPEIARRTLAENVYSANIVEQLTSLIDSIPEGGIRLLRDSFTPDAAEWEAYGAPHFGHSWLQVPWFFAEHYFYRRILEATGYFRPGPGFGLDPFEYQKAQGLEAGREAFRRLNTRATLACEWTASSLSHLLWFVLWANQADLSLWPADGKPADRRAAAEADASRLLADDRGGIAETLIEGEQVSLRVDLVADNAGEEIVGDLLLADYLLRCGSVSEVDIHLKAHPTFVSDATIKDVHSTIAFLLSGEEPPAPDLARNLQGHLTEDRLRLRQDSFWTSPLPMWQMPPTLQRELQASDLVIFKGDANYRRLLGDRHWDFDTPFEAVVGYMPAPVVALRTLKSEIATGLKTGQVEAAGLRDPEWMVNGRWGIIQFAPARTRG